MNITKIWAIVRRFRLYLAGGLAFFCAGYWDMAKVWERLTEAWPVKLALSFIESVAFAMFGEPTAAMKAVFILVVVDFATKLCAISKEAGGFANAWKNDDINSKGMKRTIPKGFWYMALITVSYQMNHFTFFGDIMGFTPVELTCTYLALIEIKSILENLRDTGMKGLEPFIGILGEKQKQLTGKRD